MASLLDLEKNAKQKGFAPTQRNIKEVGASDVIQSYLVGYSSEGALKRSVDSLEGFCSYWEEQAKIRDNLTNAVDYLNQVNTIFNSYKTIRKNLDGTIAYLIGDWLCSCRNRFFPSDDRKTRGLWSAFLKDNLCNGFEKSTAYEFMAIAEKLENYRFSKLPIHTLKALLRAHNSGVDIKLLDVGQISAKAILALRENTKDSFKIFKSNMIKLRNESDALAEKFQSLQNIDIDKNEVVKLKNSVEKLLRILSSFHNVE